VQVIAIWQFFRLLTNAAYVADINYYKAYSGETAYKAVIDEMNMFVNVRVHALFILCLRVTTTSKPICIAACMLKCFFSRFA